MSRDSEPSAGEGPADRAKRVAAERAAEMVEDGMRVGLGTGSTARHLIARLGERVAPRGCASPAPRPRRPPPVWRWRRGSRSQGSTGWSGWTSPSTGRTRSIPTSTS